MKIPFLAIFLGHYSSGLVNSQWRENIFWTGGAENIKYKFYFASKFPSICIN